MASHAMLLVSFVLATWIMFRRKQQEDITVTGFRKPRRYKV
jgi:hypothetical protein